MKNLLTITLVAVLAVSCSENVYPDFQSEIIANCEYVTSELLINSSSDLCLYHDYLILFADIDNKCMHVYNKDTGQHLNSFFNYGNGSKEILTGDRHVQFDSQTGICTMFDLNKKTELSFQMDSLMNYGLEAVREERTAYSNYLRYVYRIDEDAYLQINSVSLMNDDQVDRIVMEESGERLFSYDEFPMPLSNESLYLYVYSHADISPDKTHLAIGTSFGAILELFDLCDDIECNHLGCYGDYKYQSSGNNVSVEGSIYGFYDFFATDSCVYCIFDGKNIAFSDFFFTDIAVFDWNGTPACLIKTDQKLEKVCVDVEEEVIYAVTWTDGKYHLARFVACNPANAD